jgi:ABC-2 type transport system permease protein
LSPASSAFAATVASTDDYLDLGEPIRGPSALSGDWRRFWHLTFTIARTEFKLRFYGSVLGYLWTLMRPLMLFGVLDVVYSLGKFGAYDPRYPAMLLSGVVMYTFFTEATGGAVGCVVDRENFVRKIQFPRLAIPLAVVLTAVFNLLANSFAIALFIYLDGVAPRVEWLELPVIFLLLATFAAGCAMLLSALYVRFRDIQPIWDVVCQVLFYVSLILIPIEKIALKGKTLLHLWMLNPLADLIQQFRHALLGPVPPHKVAGVLVPPDPAGNYSAAQAIGGYVHLMAPIGICVVIIVVGFVVFNRSAPHIADNL